MWPLCEKGSLFSLYLVASQISLWLFRLGLCLGMNPGAVDGSPFHLIPCQQDSFLKPGMGKAKTKMENNRHHVYKILYYGGSSPQMCFLGDNHREMFAFYCTNEVWGHEVPYPDHDKIRVLFEKNPTLKYGNRAFCGEFKQIKQVTL